MIYVVTQKQGGKGMDKKETIKALESHFGVKAKYLGVPSFAYRIETKEEIFTIDRSGLIHSADGNLFDVTDLITLLQESDLVKEESGLEVTIPFDGHTYLTLKNLLNMIFSKQTLIMKAFDLKGILLEQTLIDEIGSKDILDIKTFREAFQRCSEDSHLGVNIDFNQETISFYLSEEKEPAEFNAFIEIISGINKVAKTLKYASAKEVQTDNEKYTFRTWLLRLGMIGDAHKGTRKILLSKLSGNSSFRKSSGEDDQVSN